MPSSLAMVKEGLDLVRREKVQTLWLQGYRHAEIAEELHISLSQITGDIRATRNELYENNKASITEHTEQSVAILRLSQKKLWGLYEESDVVSVKVRILDEIRQLEIGVAKIRGLLTSRSIADVIHHVKLYDFEDSFPDAKIPTPNVNEKQIVDVVHKLLPEGADVIPAASEVFSNDTQGELLIPHDDIIDTSALFMANGVVIELPDGSEIELPADYHGGE